MYGLCLPTGSVYLILEDNTKELIMSTDEENPRNFILKDKYVFDAINEIGYTNVKEIVYERNGKKTNVNILDYYLENGDKLLES